LFLSDRLKPKAKIILRWVSIRHGMPFSMRAMVIGDTSAFLASSVLLISKDSLTFFKELPLIHKPFRKKLRKYKNFFQIYKSGFHVISETLNSLDISLENTNKKSDKRLRYLMIICSESVPEEILTAFRSALRQTVLAILQIEI